MWPLACAANASPVPARIDLVTCARVTERVAEAARIVVTGPRRRSTRRARSTAERRARAARDAGARAPARSVHRLTMP